VLLLQAQKFILGRRGYSVVGGKYGAPRLIPLQWRWRSALAFVPDGAALPVFLPYAALFNAAFSPVATTLVTLSTFTMHNIEFVLFDLSATHWRSRTPSSSAPRPPPSAPRSRW
jgi:iron(III) transport system permease protein